MMLTDETNPKIGQPCPRSNGLLQLFNHCRWLLFLSISNIQLTRSTNFDDCQWIKYIFVVFLFVVLLVHCSTKSTCYQTQFNDRKKNINKKKNMKTLSNLLLIKPIKMCVAKCGQTKEFVYFYYFIGQWGARWNYQVLWLFPEEVISSNRQKLSNTRQ